MCNIVDQFERRGERRGFERGEKRGEILGKNKMLFAYFKSGESAEKAAEVFELPLDKVIAVHKEWEKQKGEH